MDLETRFKICSEILEEYLPLISQMDMNVIENFNNRVQHPWIDKVQTLTQEQLVRFDAYREHTLLECPDWSSLIHKIKKVTKFNKVELKEKSLASYGNQKKQHELAALYSYLESLKSKKVNAIDFGGGVGNLAFFLEDELDMIPTVIEQDIDLIQKGRKRADKKKSSTTFKQSLVDGDFQLDTATGDLAIGLHTCGNFAVDMMKSCAHNKLKHIVNFGCCYSKIQNDQYHLSSLANHELKFSSRALASATLGFGETISEIYNFRIRIMDYKFSFYHYISQIHGVSKFCPMSNSRRSLYQLSFYEFMTKSINKYYPDFEVRTKEEIDSFYETSANRRLNSYFQCYYAISRYIGEVLEIYLLTDRALYLKELGYKVEIKQFFDPKISPRNKGIIATI